MKTVKNPMASRLFRLIDLKECRSLVLLFVFQAVVTTTVNAQLNPKISDNNVCAGSPVELSSTGDIVGWYDRDDNVLTELDNKGFPAISKNPTVYPMETTTYTVRGVENGHNLITNGDFELSDAQFIYDDISDYTYYNGPNPEDKHINGKSPQSAFSIGTLAEEHNGTAVNGGTYFLPVVSRHNDGGQFMVVEGGKFPTISVYEAETNDVLEKGTTYVVSLWVANIQIYLENPFHMEVFIKVGGKEQLIGDMDSYESSDWYNFQAIYKHETASQKVTLIIRNKETNEKGNDFVIDDIELMATISKDITVNVLPTPIITMNDHVVDEGKTLKITNSVDQNGAPIVDHSWTGADIFDPSTTNTSTPTIRDNVAPGEYYVTYTATNNIPCSSSKEIKVVVKDLHAFCSPGNGAAAPDYIISASHLPAGYIYGLMKNGSYLREVQAGVDHSIGYHYPGEGSYEIVGYKIVAPGEDDYVTLNMIQQGKVTIPPARTFLFDITKGNLTVKVDLQDEELTIGETLKITNKSNPSANITEHKWGGDTGLLNQTQTDIFEPTLENTGTPGTYSLEYTATEAGGCTSTGTMKVVILDKAKAPNDTKELCEGETYTLPNPSSPSFRYEWFEPDGTTPLPAGTTTLNKTGRYVVKAYSSSTTADDTGYIDLTVHELPAIQVNGGVAVLGTAFPIVNATPETPLAIKTHEWTGTNAASLLSATNVKSPTLLSSVTEGTYDFTYTATNAKGCEDSKKISIQVVAQAPVPALTPEICEGETYSVASYRNSAFRYVILDPAGNVFAGDEISDPGKYVVQGFNANNSSNTADATGYIDLTVNPLPSIDVEDKFIAKGAVGVIENNTTGNGVLTHSWSGTGVNTLLSNVSVAEPTVIKNDVEASYRLNYSVTDANTCTSTQTVNVDVVAVPNVTEEICKGDPAPQLPSTTSANYAYKWYDVDGNPFSGTSISEAGVYKVEVVNIATNAIAAGGSVNLVVNPLPDIQINAAVAFLGVDYLIPNSTPETPLALKTHEWTGTNVATILDATDVKSPTLLSSVAEGTYDLTYTATNSKGCKSSLPVSIRVVDEVEVPELTPEICAGETYSLEYFRNSPFRYTIFDLDGSVFTGDEISVSGSYEVHGFNANNTTSTPDAKGSIELTVNPLPTIDLENQTAIFESPYLIINNSTDIGTHIWSGTDIAILNDPTIKEPTVLETVAEGTYALQYKMTDTNGCSNSISISIDVVDKLVLNDKNLEICADDEIVLSDYVPHKPRFSYDWYGSDDGKLVGSTSIADPDVPVNKEKYYIAVGYESGIAVDTGIVFLRVFDLPTVELHDKVLSEGQTYTILNNVTGSSDIATHKWSGDVNIIQSVTVKEPSVKDNVKPGVYNLSYLATDENTCTITESVQIEVREGAVLPNGTFSVCPDSSFTLPLPDPGFEYIWKDAAGHDVSSEKVTETGVYTVYAIDPLVSTTEPINDSKITLTHHILPTPVINNGVNGVAICPNEGVTFDAGNYVSYLWNDGSTNQTITINTFITEAFVKVIDANGCPGESNVVTVIGKDEPALVEIPQDTIFCTGDSTLLVAPSDDFVEFEWFLDGELISTESQIFVSQAGEYTYTVSDQCFPKKEAKVNIDLYPQPQFDVVDNSEPEELMVSAVDGMPPYEFALIGKPNPYLDFSKTVHLLGVYGGQYELQVKDANSCANKLQVEVKHPPIEIPNFFSPNGDGFNDTWIIDGLEGKPETEIWVFNRYGKVLVNFIYADYKWDGRANGFNLPMDSYWYVLKVPNYGEVIKGNVTIVR